MKRRLVTLAAAAAMSISGASCSPGTAPDSTDLTQFTANEVSARLNAGKLEIHNGTASAKSYAVIERFFFEHALASWCMGVDQCGAPIAAGQTITIPLADIQNYNATASEAILFSWPRPASTLPGAAGDVKQLVVAIR